MIIIYRVETKMRKKIKLNCLLIFYNLIFADSILINELMKICLKHVK